MALYYFDIETVPLEQYRNDAGASFDPSKAKIISIQYQRLDSQAGQLIILKEWTQGSSERAIVERFKKIFTDYGIWSFIPVGNNLAFECKFMKYKLKQHCNLERLKLGQRPTIDLKHVLVMLNNCSFKGYSISIGKCGIASSMIEWYYREDWSLIENYIRKETLDFIKVYTSLAQELPKIKPF